jgi:uncharacterized membrane protein YciS (DUF1049 family)
MGYQNFEILDVNLQTLFSFGVILTRVLLGMFRYPVHIALIRGTSVLKIRHLEDIAEDGR